MLALPGAFEFENGRVWKRIDFAAMDRLHEDGYITNPHREQESVHLDSFLRKGWPQSTSRNRPPAPDDRFAVPSE